MKRLFLVFILFNIFIVLNNTPSYAANNFIIKHIYFEGLQRIPINTILSNIPFHVGDTINENDIAHAIKMLFATGNFENIYIFKENGKLIIQVKEYPLISHITFYGNKTIKKDILNNNLKLHGIQTGKLFNEKHIFEIEETLKNFYCDIGKYNTTINSEMIILPNNKIDLKIKFNEGKSTYVKKINIIGNKQFHTKKLLKLFQLHNNISGMNRLFKKKYQKNILLNDLKSLNYFYLNRGFAKFNINSSQIRLTPERKNIYLSIYITEGPQYKISNIFINGNLSDFSNKIHSSLKIHSNEIYNYQKIQNTIQNIKKILGNYGYISPNIITELQTDDINKKVKIYLNIDIGKRFYVNKIEFQGNTFTKDLVLRREIRQMEKTWINNRLIYQSQERLNRIGYFESVKIKTDFIPTKTDQVNIIYKIKERNSGNMNINIGIGTESGINFQCGIQQENLLGSGNSFMLNSIKNNHQIYTELSTTHPYFTIDNISLEEKIFYNDFNANNTDLANYGLKSYGINSNIGLPINEYNTLHFSLDYTHTYLSNIKPQVAIWRYLNSQGIYPKITIDLDQIKNKKTPNNINFNSNDLFLNINWQRNSLNDAYFPTYGSYSDISGKITLPCSKNEYYKITINSNHYIPLYKHSNNWILMGRIYSGYSAGLHKKESPFYDNFYSGGTNIIRGFRSNTIGPKAAYYKCNFNEKSYNACCIENSKDAIGGNAITILKGEIIFPSPFLNKKYTNIVRTSIFIDCGTIWDTYWKNTSATRLANIPNYKNPSNIRISNGLSVQWISPIGPIIFSYAKLIKKYAEDRPEQFQFNIGKTW